jgi:hypothetical protein
MKILFQIWISSFSNILLVYMFLMIACDEKLNKLELPSEIIDVNFWLFVWGPSHFTYA